ncbi:hypothetical protein PanWU01x14_019530, partial [Parasponia andersonii]
LSLPQHPISLSCSQLVPSPHFFAQLAGRFSDGRILTDFIVFKWVLCLDRREVFRGKVSSVEIVSE